MTRDEFIIELKKILPPYLRLEVYRPAVKRNADILVYLDYASEPCQVFCGKTLDDDTGEYFGYIYKDCCFHWEHIYFNATFEMALNYFKTVTLNVVAKLKNILDNYDREAIDDILTELGFTNPCVNYYLYESDDFRIDIYTLDPEDVYYNYMTPFRLNIWYKDVIKQSANFVNLDDLLDFIVKGKK